MMMPAERSHNGEHNRLLDVPIVPMCSYVYVQSGKKKTLTPIVVCACTRVHPASFCSLSTGCQEWTEMRGV
jgi:hypothetical protein